MPKKLHLNLLWFIVVRQWKMKTFLCGKPEWNFTFHGCNSWEIIGFLTSNTYFCLLFLVCVIIFSIPAIYIYIYCISQPNLRWPAHRRDGVNRSSGKLWWHKRVISITNSVCVNMLVPFSALVEQTKITEINCIMIQVAFVLLSESQR